MVQVVASGPDVAGDPLYESLLALVFAARDRIWIVTPYFVPDEMLARALTLAARRGVDVRLIVPLRSNHITADLARAGYLRDLHKAGAQRLALHACHAPRQGRRLRRSARRHRLGQHGHAQPFPQLRGRALRLVAGAGRRGRGLGRALMADSKPELPAPGWARELFENVVRLLSPLL